MSLLSELCYHLRFTLGLWFVQCLTNWLPENRVTIRLRGILVSLFLGRCGKNMTLARGVTFLNPHGIVLRDDVYLVTGCWVDGIG